MLIRFQFLIKILQIKIQVLLLPFIKFSPQGIERGQFPGDIHPGIGLYSRIQFYESSVGALIKVIIKGFILNMIIDRLRIKIDTLYEQNYCQQGNNLGQRSYVDHDHAKRKITQILCTDK
jgi:hypothetical protein